MTQLGGITGGELIFRIGLPLVALASVSATAPGKGLSADAIRGLQKSLSVEDFKWAVQQFIDCTKILIVDERGAPHPKTGQKMSSWHDLSLFYDAHFSGQWTDWMQWLQFVAEVNFGDFFGAGASPADRPPAPASPSSSQPTATGSTGAS